MSTTTDAWLRFDGPEDGYYFFKHEPTETRVPVAVGTVVPAPVRQMKQGVAFGPLFMRTRGGSTTAVSDIRFGADDGDDSFFGLLSTGGIAGAGVGTAAVASPETEDAECTRRDILRVGAMAVGGATMVSTVAAAEETTTVAEIDIEQTDGPFQLGVGKAIADMLPPNQVYTLTIDGDEAGSFNPQRGETIGIAEQRINSGGSTLKLQTDDPGIMAIVGGLGSNDTLVFKTELATSPRDQRDGTVIPLWRDPIIVDPLRRVGGNDASLQVGGESIPHSEEREQAVGEFYVTQDGELAYKVGRSPPSGTAVELKLRIGRVAEALDDIKRGI